jgi:hypothetical protein
MINIIIFIFLLLFAFLIKEGAERAYDKFTDKMTKADMDTLYHRMSFLVRLFGFFALGIATKDFQLAAKLS